MANLAPLFANAWSSTVQSGSTAIGSSSATGVNVATGDGANLPTIGSNEYIPAVIVDTSTSPPTVKEYVWITARSTDALTVVRQAEDSTRFAASTTTIQAGYTIYATMTANSMPFALSWGPPAITQHLAFVFDPDLMSSGSNQTLTAGVVFGTRLWIPHPITVSTIDLFVTTAGASLTASQCQVGLYDESGNRLVVNTDQSANWQSTNTRSATISATTLPSGPVIVAMVANGASTLPAIRGYGSASGYRHAGPIHAGSLSASYRAFSYSTGVTSLPATITMSSLTPQSTEIWAGLR